MAEPPVVARVGTWSVVLGSQRIVNALGASIVYRLEPSNSAQRFPLLLTELWNGRLAAGRAAAALAELETATRELSALPPDRAVWSVSDLRRRDDSSEPVDHAARSLADYFVAPDGRPLLTLLREALQQAQLQGQPLTVATWARQTGWRRGALFAATGLAGTVVCLRWFPGAVVTPEPYSSGHTRHGLLVWVLFLMLAGAGAWELAQMAMPRLARWRSERGAFAAVLGAVFLVAAVWWGWR